LRVRATEEASEDLLAVSERDARSIIVDAQLQGAIGYLRCHADAAVGRCVFQRVVE
jgi:hypothetical protein